jgi:hypothetical protein
MWAARLRALRSRLVQPIDLQYLRASVVQQSVAAFLTSISRASDARERAAHISNPSIKLARYAMMLSMTLPCTSVSRKSRPWKR